MKRNITKQLLRVRGSVRDSDSVACIRAGTARAGNSETVRSTQCQFRVFKNMNCFMSLRRRHLDKVETLLFVIVLCYPRNSTMLPPYVS